jgi:hypothetical protein
MTIRCRVRVWCGGNPVADHDRVFITRWDEGSPVVGDHHERGDPRRTVDGRGGPSARTNTYNVLDVTLAQDVPMPDVDVTRNFYTTSSCGVCGKASLDAVRLISRYSPGDQPARVAAQTLTALPANSGQLRRFSPAPEGCMVRRYSTSTARCRWYARTSAATTPSTR